MFSDSRYAWLVVRVWAYLIVGNSMRFRAVSWKPAKILSDSFALLHVIVHSHSGFKALLIVPAMHAADRRSLNSNPSFDTKVTYSLTFSELMAAMYATELVGTGDGSMRHRSKFDEALAANTKARHHVSEDYIIVLSNTVQTSDILHPATISTLQTPTTKHLRLFTRHGDSYCGYHEATDSMDLPL